MLAKRFAIPVIRCLKTSYTRSYTTKDPGAFKVISQKHGNVTMIGLNNPEKRNAIDYDMLMYLMEELSEAEEDPECKAVVLYGERGNLSIGCDEQEFNIDPDITNKMSLALNERFLRIPSVAAVSGYALGLGFELALWCDFRIVEETTVMGFPRKFGVPISERTAERLSSILGHQKALDWVLTGRSVKAKEAFDCGVATRLVAVGSSIGQAFNIACGLAIAPAACLRADRAAIYLASAKLSQEHGDILEAERKLMEQAAYQDIEKKLQDRE